MALKRLTLILVTSLSLSGEVAGRNPFLKPENQHLMAIPHGKGRQGYSLRLNHEEVGKKRPKLGDSRDAS